MSKVTHFEPGNYTYEPVKEPPLTADELVRTDPQLRDANQAIVELLASRINRAVDEFEKSPECKAYIAEIKREFFECPSEPPVRGGLADLLFK